MGGADRVTARLQPVDEGRDRPRRELQPPGELAGTEAAIGVEVLQGEQFRDADADVAGESGVQGRQGDDEMLVASVMWSVV